MNKGIFLSIFLALLISSCGIITNSVQDSCIRLRFKERDLFWVNPYKVNDILVFQSNRNNTDSLKIVNKEFTKPKDSRECNWFVSLYLSESVRLDYQFFHDKKWTEQKNLLYLEKRPKKEGNELILRAFQLEYFNPNLQTGSTFLKKLNVQVTDCYIFEHDKARVLDSRMGITKFYWSKSLGLIKYESKDGETWELI
jgi:hypothetical protein